MSIFLFFYSGAPHIGQRSVTFLEVLQYLHLIKTLTGGAGGRIFLGAMYDIYYLQKKSLKFWGVFYNFSTKMFLLSQEMQSDNV